MTDHALNGIAYRDDRQVCDLHLIRETHADVDRVHVHIEEAS